MLLESQLLLFSKSEFSTKLYSETVVPFSSCIPSKYASAKVLVLSNTKDTFAEQLLLALKVVATLVHFDEPVTYCASEFIVISPSDILTVAPVAPLTFFVFT